MAGLGRRLLGAALVGYGTGIVELAKSKRQDALLKLRRKWQKEDQAASTALTCEGWERADERAADARAADARAAEGRAHDLALPGVKADAPPATTTTSTTPGPRPSFLPARDRPRKRGSSGRASSSAVRKRHRRPPWT